jgi:hypothetical protein
MKKNLLLIADAAAGNGPAETKTPTLTINTVELAKDIKAKISAFDKDAAALTPLLGFALTNLRGALNAIEGHNTKTAVPPPAAPAGAK